MLKPIAPKAKGALRAKALAGAGGFLAAALSLGYSLYESREADNIAQVAVATPIDAGRWKVSLNAGAIDTQLPDGSRILPGKQAIVVDMMLENTSQESSNIYSDLIKLENVPDAPRPQFYLTRDHDLLWDLQPMMPEPVKAVWQVPVESNLPKVLTVHVEGALFKPRDNLYAAPGWFSSGTVAQVALPLVADAAKTGVTP